MNFLMLIPIIAIGFWYVYLRKRNQYILPSGPPGLPIIGNIHQLIVKNPFEKLSQWAYNYPKIYTINLCGKKAVVINEPKFLRKILKTFNSTGKFQTDSLLLISQGPYGILNSEGEVWLTQRALWMKRLKEFGFGNKRMETLILSEAMDARNWIKKESVKLKNDSKILLNIHPIFIQSVINTVWSMVAGRRIILGDSKMTNLLKTFSKTLQHTMKTGLCFLPWLKYIAPNLSGYTKYKKACLYIWKHIEEEFMEHKRSFSAGVHRDLIDAYIEESGNDPLKWKHSVATVVELFLAASESTGSTITFLLYYLSVNMEIQEKLQKEIYLVIGENEEIFLDQKLRMPYIEAVILETLRFSSMTPAGSIHQLLDDIEIDSYKFPEGLLLIPNLYYCHMNKHVWRDPEFFRPERFLDEDAEKLKDHLVPFQLGKRQCAGEPLARDMLFIYVAKIFQQFDVRPDLNLKREEYYEPDIGLFLFPRALGLYFTPRSKYL